MADIGTWWARESSVFGCDTDLSRPNRTLYDFHIRRSIRILSLEQKKRAEKNGATCCRISTAVSSRGGTGESLRLCNERRLQRRLVKLMTDHGSCEKYYAMVGSSIRIVQCCPVLLYQERPRGRGYQQHLTVIVTRLSLDHRQRRSPSQWPPDGSRTLPINHHVESTQIPTQFRMAVPIQAQSLTLSTASLVHNGCTLSAEVFHQNRLEGQLGSSDRAQRHVPLRK